VVKRIIIFAMLLGLVHAAPAGSGKFSWKQRVSPVENKAHSGLNFKPVLASLVMPGWGEYQMGHSGWAKGFVLSEVMLWLSYAGITRYSRVLEKDYQAYAALHAGVNPAGKDEQYWIDIGNANNIYQFNERRRIQRNLEATYPETDAYYWQWDTEANRFHYGDLRDRQYRWERATIFVFSGMILNRLFSAINVIRLQKSGQSRASADNWMLNGNAGIHPAAGEFVTVQLQWNF